MPFALLATDKYTSARVEARIKEQAIKRDRTLRRWPFDYCVLTATAVEYALKFEAASVARTRYMYTVAGVSPVSLYEVPVVVPICAKLLHPDPWQRSTKYPVTPTLSLDGAQDRLISVDVTEVGDGATATTADCHVAAVSSEKVASYVPDVATALSSAAK